MNIVVNGLEIAQAELIEDGNKVVQILNDAVQIFGQMAWERVREYASGRPGPNIITGEYRDSIELEIEIGESGLSQAVIFSDAIFSDDLEYGREGIFAHPAYPHFGPAAEEIEDEFLNYVLEKLDEL